MLCDARISRLPDPAGSSSQREPCRRTASRAGKSLLKPPTAILCFHSSSARPRISLLFAPCGNSTSNVRCRVPQARRRQTRQRRRIPTRRSRHPSRSSSSMRDPFAQTAATSSSDLRTSAAPVIATLSFNVYITLYHFGNRLLISPLARRPKLSNDPRMRPCD